MSIPIQRRLQISAAIAVLPEPMKGSKAGGDHHAHPQIAPHSFRTLSILLRVTSMCFFSMSMPIIRRPSFNAAAAVVPPHAERRSGRQHNCSPSTGSPACLAMRPARSVAISPTTFFELSPNQGCWGGRPLTTDFDPERSRNSNEKSFDFAPHH